MIVKVTLAYPNGQRDDVQLAGVPRVGEQVRRLNGPESSALVVEYVVWMEGSGADREPAVLVGVRHHPGAPA